jgi:hypothetical protein
LNDVPYLVEVVARAVDGVLRQLFAESCAGMNTHEVRFIPTAAQKNTINRCVLLSGWGTRASPCGPFVDFIFGRGRAISLPRLTRAGTSGDILLLYNAVREGNSNGFS